MRESAKKAEIFRNKVNIQNHIFGSFGKKLPLPGFEPGFSEPQSEVLTTILQ
jgi:hypothetical protein